MDLWAHFSENYRELSEEDASGQTRARRAGRRSGEHVLFDQLRDWLLQDYVAAYCRSLAATRIFRRCYWIDALGLEGRAMALPVDEAANGTGKGRKKAPTPLPPALQPVVALAQKLTGESKPITLYAQLLSAGSSRRGIVRPAPNDTNEADKAFTVPKENGIITASWLEAAPFVLKTIEPSPAIFLLNPLGATLFQSDDLTPLYARAVPTELCLFLPHKQIEARLLAANTQPQQATELNSLLRTDRWKALSIEEEARPQAIQGFIELLSGSLQRHFSYPVQALRFPLVAGPAWIEPAPFTLLFATRRLDSLCCMNDAVFQHYQRVEEASYRGVLSEHWFIEQQQIRRAEALERFRERIRQQGQVQRRSRWPDLRQQLLLSHFGQFPLQDYDTIIQQLLLSREVSCAWRQASPDDGTLRIPGNDDMLIWR